LVMSTAPAPDKDCVPRTTSEPKEELTVTAPEVELIEMDWKPFSERTGPLNVVFAMIFPYMQVRRINLHVVSRDCLIHRKARIENNIHQKKKGHKAPFKIFPKKY
jgi:hypothetical protein